MIGLGSVGLELVFEFLGILFFSFSIFFFLYVDFIFFWDRFFFGSRGGVWLEIVRDDFIFRVVFFECICTEL